MMVSVDNASGPYLASLTRLTGKDERTLFNSRFSINCVIQIYTGLLD